MSGLQRTTVSRASTTVAALIETRVRPLIIVCLISLLPVTAGGQEPLSELPLEFVILPLRDTINLGDSLEVEFRVYNRSTTPVVVNAPLYWPHFAEFITIQYDDGTYSAARNMSYPDALVHLDTAWSTRIPPGAFVGREILLAGSGDPRAPSFLIERGGRIAISGLLDVYSPATDQGARLEANVAYVYVRDAADH